MIQLFHGEDSFDSYAHAKQAANHITQTLGCELIVYDCDDGNVADFSQYLTSLGLFGKQKVVLAKRLFSNRSIQDYLEQNLHSLQTQELIIWEPGKVDGRLKLTKELRKAAKEYESETLKPYTASRWLISYAKELQINITTTQAEYIIQRRGLEKGVLANELLKIRSYLQDQNKITDHQLALVLGVDRTGDMWNFLDYLALGKIDKAVTEFEILERFGESDQLLLAMIGRELWLLGQVVDAQTKGYGVYSLGINKFVLDKTITKAKRFNFQVIDKLYQGLTRLDGAIKQGRVPAYHGIYIYLLSWPR